LLETDLNQISSKDFEANNIIKIKDYYHMNKSSNEKCSNGQCNNAYCKLELEKLNKRVIFLTKILLKSQDRYY
jgi:hypothetical protein